MAHCTTLQSATAGPAPYRVWRVLAPRKESWDHGKAGKGHSGEGAEVARFLVTERVYDEKEKSPTVSCSLNWPPGEEGPLSLVSALMQGRERAGPCTQHTVAKQPGVRAHGASLASSWAVPPSIHSFFPETLAASLLCVCLHVNAAHAVLTTTPIL